jgi:hypothetical protein
MTEYDSDGVEIVGAKPHESRARKNSAFKSKPKPARTVPEKLLVIIDKPDTVAERVDYIGDLMFEWQWERGKTGKKIAAHWGMSQSVIDDYATEASRRVIGDVNSIKRDVTAVASKLLFYSARAGNIGDVWKMADTLAKISGANSPTKQEMVIAVGDSTPKTAREIMSAVFKGDVGSEAAVPVESESYTDADSSE